MAMSDKRRTSAMETHGLFFMASWAYEMLSNQFQQTLRRIDCNLISFWTRTQQLGKGRKSENLLEVSVWPTAHTQAIVLDAPNEEAGCLATLALNAGAFYRLFQPLGCACFSFRILRDGILLSPIKPTRSADCWGTATDVPIENEDRWATDRRAVTSGRWPEYSRTESSADSVPATFLRAARGYVHKERHGKGGAGWRAVTSGSGLPLLPVRVVRSDEGPVCWIQDEGAVWKGTGYGEKEAGAA
ncbi:hypothetical protein BJ508DRAFT_312378 [Ascobolus immersus RN42]|uniref:Uncharacterized protein n=1 Tax=Ascobolus immersus RN42 TaxID=1160509 RepID=A0A3N4HRA3_ASCIM|nr:hypothetical protein BJ508DRAFT_312378 [Ascobolus immersus RN42]